MDELQELKKRVIYLEDALEALAKKQGFKIGTVRIKTGIADNPFIEKVDVFYEGRQYI